MPFPTLNRTRWGGDDSVRNAASVVYKEAHHFPRAGGRPGHRGDSGRVVSQADSAAGSWQKVIGNRDNRVAVRRLQHLAEKGIEPSSIFAFSVAPSVCRASERASTHQPRASSGVAGPPTNGILNGRNNIKAAITLPPSPGRDPSASDRQLHSSRIIPPEKKPWERGSLAAPKSANVKNSGPGVVDVDSIWTPGGQAKVGEVSDRNVAGPRCHQHASARN